MNEIRLLMLFLTQELKIFQYHKIGANGLQKSMKIAKLLKIKAKYVENTQHQENNIQFI